MRISDWSSDVCSADLQLGAEIGIIVLLIALNLRGVKESIMVLAPIFLGFFITHAFLIVYGGNAHAGALSGVVQATWHGTLQLSMDSGWSFTVRSVPRPECVRAGTAPRHAAVQTNTN